METLVISNSRWKYALFLVATLFCLGAGIFLLRIPKATGEERFIAWLAVFTFGFTTAVNIWRFVDSRPRLRITAEGIDDRTLGLGIIPWPEITDAYVKSIKSHDFVCLVLRSPEKWIDRLSPVKKMIVKANRVLGFTEVNINLSGTSADAQQVHELILKVSATSKETQEPSPGKSSLHGNWNRARKASWR